MKKFRNIVLLALVAVVLGYYLVSVLNPRVQFNVVTLKREGERIYDVRVWFEEFRMFRFGDLWAMETEMGQSRFLMHYGAWPSELYVEWKAGSREDEPIRRVLPVSERLPFRRNENLELVIEFKEYDVIAYPRVAETPGRGPRYRYGD